MKKITIERYKSSATGDRTEEHERWRRECDKKLGYKGDEYLYCGAVEGEMEFVVLEGRIFKRNVNAGTMSQKFFRLEEGERGFPEILCECGNSLFQARYGHYELILRCSVCHTEECVYSG